MKVHYRNKNLSYPMAIRDNKALIVLDWLLEFRFSNNDILATRLDQTPVNINRFINNLINAKLIQTFRSTYVHNRRFYMLAANGVSFLESRGRHIEHAVTRTSVVGKYSTIIQELSLQYAILNRLDDYEEVIANRNIPFHKRIAQADALLLTKKRAWQALEYERIRKNKDRIYDKFQKHAQAINKGYYSSVAYIFESKSDLNHYQTLFKQENWSDFLQSQSNIKPTSTPQIITPDKLQYIKKAFEFILEVDQRLAVNY